MTQKWQNAINMLLSIWLFISPWVMGYRHEVAAWDAYIFGIVCFLVAAFAMRMAKPWENLLNLLLGTWLVVSPFLLRFSGEDLIAINTVAVGVLFVVFAAWALYADDEAIHRRLGEHQMQK